MFPPKQKGPQDDEVLCSRCNGTGWDPIQIESPFVDREPKITIVCNFCNGYGFVNWIDNILGPKPKISKYLEYDLSYYNIGIDSAINNSFTKEMVDILGEEMAKKIDKEILETLLKESNK